MESKLALSTAAFLLVGVLALAMLAVGMAAQAQIPASPTQTTTFPTTTPPGAPGVPSTGAGGEAAMNAFLLLASALLIAGGTGYVYRKFAREINEDEA